MKNNQPVLANALNRIIKHIKDGMNQTADDTIELIDGEISSKFPPASAPGEPPHMRSGELKASNRSEVDSVENKVTIKVSNTSSYAGYLEFGTEKMAPRPFFRPAMDEVPAIVKKNLTYHKT